jgi:hypothetical protein
MIVVVDAVDRGERSMTTFCSFAMVSVLILSAPPATDGDEYRPPARVIVQPVFFVPKGEQPPSERQADLLLRHLKQTQARYKELLGGRDTFTLAEGKPQVLMAERELDFYRQAPGGGASDCVCELLRRDKLNRYNCPYIYVAIFMNSHDSFPAGGARPCNGGFNTGGGILIMSSFGLDEASPFQSTMQHELGHAFGLPHVDVYGYDMMTNMSLMSYNPSHHTHGLQPSATPGVFIPEDVRGLALNRRAFPRLRYDPPRDCPPGYSIVPQIIGLGPMELAGPPLVAVTTPSGEACGSRVANIVSGQILPNEKSKQPAASETATFDPQTMWQSERTADGWATVRITFPFDVQLTKVAIHSQHGGLHDAAEAVRIAAGTAEGLRAVASQPLKSADAAVSFPPQKARSWELAFKAGKSGVVVIRGLQFFSGDAEIFPPLVPCPQQ